MDAKVFFMDARVFFMDTKVFSDPKVSKVMQI